ncbi:MAG TPA: preprotein translocase subunit YajC [Lentisphaeria bacterium]|nr:MAG: preprotein translocase subunit YajC [Lentisphaerae bacterium GWF2_38_69]HBM14878.1 preprotein translocase subunit YajC [Lentisphaeria bacterium]
MNFLTLSTEAAAQGGGIQGMLVSFGPFILIIVVMYFLLFRSQSKKAKERQRMLDAIRVGDKVLAAGGIIGVVNSIKEKSMFIKIAENVKIEVMRSSVNGVLEKGEETTKE